MKRESCALDHGSELEVTTKVSAVPKCVTLVELSEK